MQKRSFLQKSNTVQKRRNFRNFGMLTPISMAEIIAEDEQKKSADFHNILRRLCILSHEENPDMQKFRDLEKWEHLEKYDYVNQSCSMYGCVYKKGDKAVIIFHCEFPNFTMQDIHDHLSRGWALPEFKEAYDYFNRIKKAVRGVQFYVTGSDIGGSAAQFVGLYNRDVQAITFNALGLGCLYPQLLKTFLAVNVINYVSSNALKLLREKHLGEVRLIYISPYTIQANSPTTENNSELQNNNLVDFGNLKYFKSSCNSLA